MLNNALALKKACAVFVPFLTIKPCKLLKLRFLQGFRGERGIRTPGAVTLNGFQDRRIRPLCHFSAAKVALFLILKK
jgi:hypothetical protein